MPIIRRVFGPFNREYTGGSVSPYDGTVWIAHDEVRWYFNGIRDDKTTAHWVLVYDSKTRKFTASNIKINDNLIGRSRLALRKLGIPSEVKREDVHPDAWLDERPVLQGRITDILKSKLSPEDIALATALAITRG